MNRFAKILTHLSLALIASVMFLSCQLEDINERHAPVELVASVTNQTLVFDPTDTSPECPDNIVVFELRNVVKQTTAARGGGVDLRFLDVRLVSTRRRFVRTDGGTVVPRTVVQSQTAIVPADGIATLPPFLAFQLEMLREAPFVAIQSSAGGRDPETGLPFVRLEVITEFFGETLAGDAVSASATYPLTVCFGCGCAPKGGG